MPLSLAFRFAVLFAAGWVNRHQQDVITYLRAELAVLREHVGDRRLPLTDDQRRRLARAGEPLGRRGLVGVASLVTPDTILRWFRELVARKYDGSRRRGSGGRPRTPDQVAALVVRVALENVRFGYTRIRDTVNHLGHDLEPSTVKRILDARGIVPAPERERTTTWGDFLRAHAGTSCAADFFPVEVITRSGITRFQVFFLMHVATRRVHVAGIVRDTDLTGAWMLQIARNLTDPVSGFLRGMRQLVLDRDPVYASAFRELLRGKEREGNRKEREGNLTQGWGEAAPGESMATLGIGAPVRLQLAPVRPAFGSS